MSVSELKTALASRKIETRIKAIRQFAETAFGISALPTLRKALEDDCVEVVLFALECIGKLGPEALSCPAGQKYFLGYHDLESQLLLTGSRFFHHTGCPNCYSDCLETLLKVEVDSEYIIDYVHNLIGLTCHDDLIVSLNALNSLGTTEAIDILKRAATFWLPELNMKYAKQVKNIVASAKVRKK
jgi:hypothetical protein